MVATIQHRPSHARRRARRRARMRGVLALVALVTIVAGIVVAVRANSAPSVQRLGGTQASGATAPTTAPPSTAPPTTAPPSTAPPTTAPPDPAFHVGIRKVTWVNPNGTAHDPATGVNGPRTLVVEIRYPTLGGSPGTETEDAPAARRYGPYPVVVFAHGYNVTPDTYQSLLDAWVRSGFVVVAPLFPEENALAIQAMGGSSSPPGESAENDLVNEPSDVAFVAGQVVAWTEGQPTANTGPTADAGFLKGLVDPNKLGLAGQSDGADAVAGLVMGASYRSIYDAMPVHPSGVELLSGAPIPFNPTTYGPPSPAPDTLVVQSATDQCNLPQSSLSLYGDLGQNRWFLGLHNASHLGPYVGVGPSAPVVSQVTTDFFKMTLDPGTVTPNGLANAVGGSPVANLAAGADVPPVSPIPVPTGAQVQKACALP